MTWCFAPVLEMAPCAASDVHSPNGLQGQIDPAMPRHNPGAATRRGGGDQRREAGNRKKWLTNSTLRSRIRAPGWRCAAAVRLRGSGQGSAGGATVHLDAIGRDLVDVTVDRGVGREQGAEVRVRQDQELAVAERADVGATRAPAEQRHLAEEVTAAELGPVAGEVDLDRARGDEVHRVAAVALADQPFARDREARLQQRGDLVELRRTEPLEQRE